MPIQSGDVKLLKSAVMADVPEGGGAPTGNTIADGVSNAIFPDISELDRAGGRVNLRKSFVSVQTCGVSFGNGSIRDRSAQIIRKRLAKPLVSSRVLIRPVSSPGEIAPLRQTCGSLA